MGESSSLPQMVIILYLALKHLVDYRFRFKGGKESFRKRNLEERIEEP